MAARYNPSYRGLGELLRSPEMEAEMRRRAEKIKVAAEASAPVYTPGTHPGRYKAAFTITSERRGGARKDRAAAYVVNDAPEALYVEYGTRNNPAHHTLLKALDAARD